MRSIYIYDDCRDCEKFVGNCGCHFIDAYNHIDYNIPCESAYDGTYGGRANCFVPSSEYKRALNEERAKELSQYSEDVLEKALEIAKQLKKGSRDERSLL